MKKVLVAQKTADSVIENLKKHAEVVMINDGDLDAFMKNVVDADAIIVGTWIKVTGEIMDQAKNLKAISRTGVGVDSVDVAEATKRGIMVLNTPSANALSVAEHALTLICALSKYVVFLNDQIKADNFKARRMYLPVDIAGKTLGLVGCGAIGRMLAAKCRAAFDMKVIGYDPYLKQDPEGITLVPTVEELCKNADYISLHIPLTPETRDTIDEKMLSVMKPGAFLINTSRGGTVNEKALYEALKSKKIAGAGLDVFEHEPVEKDSPLLTLDNIILTPHSAALTKECSVRVASEAAENVIEFVEGKTPRFVFNKEVLK